MTHLHIVLLAAGILLLLLLLESGLRSRLQHQRWWLLSVWNEQARSQLEVGNADAVGLSAEGAHQLVTQLQQLCLCGLGAVERIAGDEALLLQHLLCMGDGTDVKSSATTLVDE